MPLENWPPALRSALFRLLEFTGRRVFLKTFLPINPQSACFSREFSSETTSTLRFLAPKKSPKDEAAFSPAITLTGCSTVSQEYGLGVNTVMTRAQWGGIFSASSSLSATGFC